MLVYEAVKSEFMNSVDNDTITDEIYDNYKIKIGLSSQPQINSWHNSMEYMYKVLNDSEIPDNAGIAIEYKIPFTANRIDFIISGFNPKNIESVILIELKQWQNVNKVEGKEGIVETFVGKANREVTHPSYQVWSYACLLENFNSVVEEDKIILKPCAYLHNYKIRQDDPLIDKAYSEFIKKAPVYCSGDALKLRSFIKKYIKVGDNKNILYKINEGKIRPSQSLQDVLASMLKGNEHFTLIDNQKIAYETALSMARNPQDTKKRVLIIEGGPGTGKSVIAINLLVQLTRENQITFYVTKNSAPRNVFFKELKGDFKESYIKTLFKSSGQFINSDENEFDVLIVDEAHRLNEKSGLYANTGENQIKEIINASKTSIFFIDNNQKVTIKDIGKTETIEKFAKEVHAEIEKIKLESQFRCNGSDGYLLWLDDVLQINNTANYNGYEYDYDFKIIDTPEELSEMIFEKNKRNNKSRLLAGYCWEWEKNERKNTYYPDITIGENFGMSWNLNNTDTWAIDKKSVNEIGCIHTSQGLEFEYVGVILGEDIRYENGKIITDFNKRAKTDRSLFGIKKMYREKPSEALKLADEIIKNTYKTLMTRGMKGCYIYCVDKKLQEYFKERLKMMHT